jgi:mannose-1-phosphate guanylyltransferase
MQAVILAGGLGTRLWPLTKEIPKPMVPIAGAPYLEHQLRLLAKQSITDVVLLTGYLGSQIEEHFGNGAQLGLQISYSREAQPLGTGGALREARHLLGDFFVLIYGDSYLPIDYVEVAKRLAISGATGVLVVYRDPSGETNVRSNVALDESGLVSRYDKTAVNDPQLEYIEAGVLAFRRTVLELIPSRGPVSLEQQVFPVLIEQRRLLGVPTSQRFYDIGTPERLKAIEAFLACRCPESRGGPDHGGACR